MSDTPALKTIDFLTHSKVSIAADTAAIWPHIVNVGAWKEGQQLVSVSGDLGSVGARFYAASPDALDTSLFYVENVELVPEHRRTIRLEGLDGSFMGFATWELTPGSDATVVAYDVYSRGPMLPPGQSEKELMATAQQLMDESLSRLKAFIEH